MRIRNDTDVTTVTVNSETNNACVSEPLIANGEVSAPKSRVSISIFYSSTVYVNNIIQYASWLRSTLTLSSEACLHMFRYIFWAI